MSNVYMPKKKTANTQGLLTVGGAVAGGIGGSGNPQAISTGASIGSTVGGALQSEPPHAAAVESAMTRRFNTLEQTPLRELRESIDSLQYIKDPAVRQELVKPLLQADYAARGKKVPGV